MSKFDAHRKRHASADPDNFVQPKRTYLSPLLPDNFDKLLSDCTQLQTSNGGPGSGSSLPCNSETNRSCSGGGSSRGSNISHQQQQQQHQQQQQQQHLQHQHQQQQQQQQQMILKENPLAPIVLGPQCDGLVFIHKSKLKLTKSKTKS